MYWHVYIWHVKCQKGWIANWNQDCWEKCQNLKYADDTTLMAESKEELQSLWMRVKEKSEKLAYNSTFRKLKSWHLVPPLQGK